MIFTVDIQIQQVLDFRDLDNSVNLIIPGLNQGLKGSLIHKYFVKWERECQLLVLKVCIKVCISWEEHSPSLIMPLFLYTIKMLIYRPLIWTISNISVIYLPPTLHDMYVGICTYFYYHLYTPDLNEDTNLASTNEVITYRKPTGNLMVRWWRSCWPQWSPQSCCVRGNFVTKKKMMLSLYSTPLLSFMSSYFR